ncbi:hypothetical protein ACSTS3_19535 [Aquimarina muelleri]|uniref:hypothetical protein n=1 Tax=Aquimarina muelleri TaxID=279356 RepID=UPI003F6882D3
MNKYAYIQYCLNILAFDNIKSQLSIAERIYLHKQWALALNQKDTVEFPINKPSNRVHQLGQLILEAKWERPELRYNSDRVLEVYDPNKCCWEIFNPSEYQ